MTSTQIAWQIAVLIIMAFMVIMIQRKHHWATKREVLTCSDFDTESMSVETLCQYVLLMSCIDGEVVLSHKHFNLYFKEVLPFMVDTSYGVAQ